MFRLPSPLILAPFVFLASAAAQPTLTTIYSFTNGADGEFPNGLTAAPDGSLFGNAAGGTSGLGLVYRLVLTSSGWTEHVVHTFSGPDGDDPRGTLLVAHHGILYGVTQFGGASGGGIVYQLTPPPSTGGPWTETILHSFVPHTSDGALPIIGVVVGPNGALYGTTSSGGTFNRGAIYELAPPSVAGNPWTETVLYSFSNGPDGGFPNELVFGAGGIIYGTTETGGTSTGGGGGVAFRLLPPAVAGGTWTEEVLHTFTGGTDGISPSAGLVLDSSGAAYGTTGSGGANDGGIVYQLKPPPISGGVWTYTILHTFGPQSNLPNPDCAAPGPLLLGNGALLGTAYYGGANGKGAVFGLTPPSTSGGAWTETILYSYTTTDGEGPSGLVFGRNNALFGTTAQYGPGGFGTAYVLR